MDRRRSKENRKAEALKMAEILLGGKKLTDLKVTELKSELDKRGLPKRGVKSILIERLKKAILEEELTQVGPVEVTEEDTEAEDSQLETSTLDTSQVSEDEFVSPAEAISEADLPQVLTEDDPQVLTEEDPQVLTEEDHRPEPAQETQEESVKEEAVREAALSPDIDVEGVTAASPKKAEMEVEVAEQDDLESVNVLELDPLASEEGTAVEDERLPQEEVELLRAETPVRDEVPPIGDHSNEPMELGTPIGSNSEFELKFEDQDQSANDSGVKIEPEIAEIEGEDSVKTSYLEPAETKTAENKDEPGNAETSPASKSARSMERLDSSIDPSYRPDSEVLLYEGDPEHEPEVKTETIGTGEDDDFIVDLHDSSMDIDEGTRAHVKQKLASEEAGAAGLKASSEKEPEQSAPGSEARRKPGETTRPPQCFLWVSGLAGAVRALDLQTLFSPFGQVISAKVVAKAHSRNHRFGYVTMATPEQAQRCIDELSGSELKGRKITVEVAKTTPPISQPDKTGKDKPTESPHLGGARGKEEGGGAEKREDKKEDGTSREKGDDKSPEKTRRPAAADKRDGGPSGQRGREHKPQRRSPSPGRERRGRSPPTRGGRVPRRRSRSRSPPRVSHRGPGAVSTMRDARHDIMRREAARRELQRREMERRMGGDPFLRERERQVEIRLEERRLVHDRQQEMLMRRRLEMEHSRREQEILRRVQESREREARERGLRERQLAEQERLFKERERELREREYRERQRREALEREIRERENRERELKERERRIREQHERELRESMAKAQREREMRERELRAQAERERVLRERERHLQEQQERVERERRAHEEQQRRTREEQERRAKEREEHERRERERRLREEKDLELKRERERQERERRERAEEDRAKQDQKRKEMALQHQQQRLGKRPFPESSPYEGAKRPAVHDVRGSASSDGYSSPSSVFRRLDQPSQSSRGDALSMVPRNEEPLGGGTSYRRGEADMSQTYERSRTGAHVSGGVSGAGFGRSNFPPVGASRERHSDSAFPLQTISAQRTASQRGSPAQRVPPGGGGGVPSQGGANIYGKMAGEFAGNRGAPGISPGVKSRPGSADPAALSRIAPEIFTRATEALENIRKTVASAGGLPLPHGGRINPQTRIGGHQITAAQLQQIATAAAASHAQHASAADYMSMNQRLSLSGAGMPAPSLRQQVIPGLGAGVVGGGKPNLHPHGVGGVMGKPHPPGGQGKLPPEGERYNRRLSRPQGHQQRQTSYKRLI